MRAGDTYEGKIGAPPPDTQLLKREAVSGVQYNVSCLVLLPVAPTGDATRYHGHGTRLGEQIRRLWQTMSSYPQLSGTGSFATGKLTKPLPAWNVSVVFNGITVG